MKNKYLILAAFAMLLYGSSTGSAAPSLGSAQSFAVLGHETVTNGHNDPNPTTQIYGNLGGDAGTSVTGFYPDGTVSGGTIHTADEVAALALDDVTSAYNTLAGLPFVYNYSGFVWVQRDTPRSRRVSIILTRRSVDRSPHSRFPGQSRCGLHFPDREYAHNREQFFC